jgi:hypothetical protein
MTRLRPSSGKTASPRNWNFLPSKPGADRARPVRRMSPGNWSICPTRPPSACLRRRLPPPTCSSPMALSANAASPTRAASCACVGMQARTSEPWASITSRTLLPTRAGSRAGCSRSAASQPRTCPLPGLASRPRSRVPDHLRPPIPRGRPRLSCLGDRIRRQSLRHLEVTIARRAAVRCPCQRQPLWLATECP